MSAFDPELIALLAGVAFTAGFVDAIAGGGGLLTVPALLSVGVPPHVLLGTNKLSSTFGSATAAFTFVRKGLFQPRLWQAATASVVVGSTAGALITRLFSAAALKAILPLAVLGASLYLVWPRRKPATRHEPGFRPSRRAKAVAGGAIGFYDGFIGPGTGAFWMAVALKYFRQDIVHAAGTARFMNFVSNACALAAFVALGQVDWALGLSMGLALMVGAWLGAHSAIRFGSPLIRPMFIAVVLAMVARLLWQQLAG